MNVVDLFGEGAEFDHVGMAMKSIDHALGDIERTFDPIQKVNVAFFQLHGLPIEAVEPCGDDSPIVNEMKKGVKLLHLCYRVPDIQKALQVARQNGLLIVAQPAPATAFDGRKIAWLLSRTMGLFELVEAPRADASSGPVS